MQENNNYGYMVILHLKHNYIKNKYSLIKHPILIHMNSHINVAVMVKLYQVIS